MDRFRVKPNRSFPQTETLICEFEFEGTPTAYRVTIDANVYRYAWTRTEVIGIATGNRHVRIYRPENYEKSVAANVIIRCDTVGNLYTMLQKLN